MAVSEGAVSVLLASAVALTAVGLALRQWYEKRQRQREPEMSGPDAEHFARQDFRRAVAGAVMGLLALGVVVGARIGHMVAGGANPWFLEVWLVVFGLILVLLGLALADWVATWRYARRQHQAIVHERRHLLGLLVDVWRWRAYRGNGQDTPKIPGDGAPMT
jgi:hypothetical protein